MHIIVITLFLEYGLILLFGLLHMAQKLASRRFPLLLPYSDSEADRDGELPRATQSPSAAQTRNRAIDKGRH